MTRSSTCDLQAHRARQFRTALFTGLRNSMKLLKILLVWTNLLPGVAISAQTASAPLNFSNVPPLLHVAVLPFHNATGSTNWADWQWALPRITWSYLNEAYATTVVPRKKVCEALLHAGREKEGEVGAEEARGVLRETRADAVLWGSFQQQQDQWLVSAWLLRSNSSAGPVSIHVAGPDWSCLPERLALAVTEQTGRRIDGAELQFMRKRLTQSPSALPWLARAVRLELEEAPEAEQEPVIRHVLEADPHCEVGYMLLLQALEEASRTNDFDKACDDLIRQCPDTCSAQCIIAMRRAQAGDEAAMEQALQQALRVHRSCPEAGRYYYFYLGLYQHRWPELRDVLTSAVALRPDRIENIILLASACAECGDGKAAEGLMERVTELPPEDPVRDVVLLDAALRTKEVVWAGLELARLGPQAATNEFVRDVLGSITSEPRANPNLDSTAKPRAFSPSELQKELERRLSPDERALVVDPVALTPEIQAEARRLTNGLTTDTLKALAIFGEVAHLGRGPGEAGIRTASQALNDSPNPESQFCCQEYAKLFVALARAAGLKSWLVHIDWEVAGRAGYHDCAAVYLDGRAVLVDPTWRVFGVEYEEFQMLDDLQAIAHQAMQPHDDSAPARLRMGLKLDPTLRWTQLQFVRGMAKAGEFEAAEAELRKVRSSGPQTWDVYEAAGELQLQRKRWKVALAELQRSLELAPSNSIAHDCIAAAYAGLGDIEKCTEHLQKALDFDQGEMPGNTRRESQFAVQLGKALAQAKSPSPGSQAQLEESARAGDLASQLALAKACFDARPPRTEEGQQWFLKAAQQGNDQAQFNYGRILLALQGKAAGREGVQWLTRSANQGFADAQYLLGKVLYEGKLVPRDTVVAGQWVLLAAQAGNKDARYLWSEMELFLSPADLASAREQAAAFKPAKEIPGKPKD
jgi:tetratricopeptide (TPR) repeat protein